MPELVRLVTFRALPGREEELLQLVSQRAIELNERFGARRVWLLQGQGDLAILSVWARPEDLDAMRADPEYTEFLDGIKARSERLTDSRYHLIASGGAAAEPAPQGAPGGETSRRTSRRTG